MLLRRYLGNERKLSNNSCISSLELLLEAMEIWPVKFQVYENLFM